LVGHDLSMCILYRFHGWLIFARVIALFMFVCPYVRLHILCTQLVICLLSHFIHIRYLGWPRSVHAHIIPISQMVDFNESYSPFHVCLTICPFAHLVYATSLLSHFIHIWYLGWRDLSMCILYRFHGWLIFARVIALFMFVCPYVHLHILCTQLVICLLSHFIHIWYLGWPWSEDAHIILISRIFDLCESYSPFHVCLSIRPSAYLVYATSHLSFVAFYSYLVSWLAMIWACAYYTDFTNGWFLRGL
jgi:hypothetical protein